MIYYGIGLAVIIFSLLLWDFIKPQMAKKTFYRNLILELNSKHISYQITNLKNTNLPGDFFLEINRQKYLIKLILVPKYAEIIVNAKTTWELRYGAGNTPGKAHPIKKYLPKMNLFMNYQNDEFLKVVVFKPDVKKKVRYLNESEMDFLEPKTNVYGVRVLNESELIPFITKKD